MRNVGYIIGGGVLVGGAIWALSRAASNFEDNITYRVTNPKIERTTGLNYEIELDLVFTNRNDRSIEIVSFTGDILSGTKDVGNFSINNLILPAQSDFTGKVKIEVSGVGLLANILLNLLNGSGWTNISINGDMQLKDSKTGITVRKRNIRENII